MLHTIQWNASGLVTFSFPRQDSRWSTDVNTGYGAITSGSEPWSPSFAPLVSSDQEFFSQALKTWSAVSGLTFEEADESTVFVGDIRVAYTSQAAFATYNSWTYQPNSSAKAGDIWINAAGDLAQESWVPGSISYLEILRAIGGAVGLVTPGASTLPREYDSQLYTIMSMAAVNGDSSSYLTFYPTTPMVLDVQAIQWLYKPNAVHNAGTSTYAFNDTQPYMQTIWDGGGIDTITYTGIEAAVIDLTPGNGSTIGQLVHAVSGASRVPVKNVWIAFGTDMEDASSGSGNDSLIGNALSNRLTGGAGDDTISGGDGNDYLIGGPGDDTIDGGAGYNVAYLSGLSSGYTTQTVGGAREMRGADGIDTFTNVLRFQFDNASLAFDIDGHAGQAYRLYRAAFDRVPDLPGMGYQMHALDSGTSLRQVASNFIASPEFQRTYGNVTDTQFVSLLYRNVLDREPEASGLEYHTGRLASGATRSEVLIGFSESPENQASVIGQIQGGITYVV